MPQQPGPAGRRDPDRGARIKRLREQRHQTQADVASAVGCSSRAYWAWEAGGPLSSGNLHLLAQALNTTTDYIVSGIEQRQNGRRALDERLRRLEAAVRLPAGQRETRDGTGRLDERVSRLEGDVARIVATLEGLLLREDEEPPADLAAERRPGSDERP